MSESAASTKLGYRSKHWEGRNRTFKHLLQRQVALPVCVLPITAEVGVEPTISCFRDRRLYQFVYSAKIRNCLGGTRTHNLAVNSRLLHH